MPAHEILYGVGAARYVGGQEGMIIDIALEILREQEAAGAGEPGPDRLSGVVASGSRG